HCLLTLFKASYRPGSGDPGALDARRRCSRQALPLRHVPEPLPAPELVEGMRTTVLLSVRTPLSARQNLLMEVVGCSAARGLEPCVLFFGRMDAVYALP